MLHQIALTPAALGFHPLPQWPEIVHEPTASVGIPGQALQAASPEGVSRGSVREQSQWYTFVVAGTNVCHFLFPRVHLGVSYDRAHNGHRGHPRGAPTLSWRGCLHGNWWRGVVPQQPTDVCSHAPPLLR